MPNRLTLIVSILKAGPEQFVGPSDDPDEGLKYTGQVLSSAKARYDTTNSIMIV
jgi:uncharacterized protein (DUF2147 family)